MTADDWEPSEAFEKAGDEAWRAAIGMGRSNRDAYLDALKAVRPLIIAEARPQIEAAERERVLNALRGVLLETEKAPAD